MDVNNYNVIKDKSSTGAKPFRDSYVKSKIQNQANMVILDGSRENSSCCILDQLEFV